MDKEVWEFMKNGKRIVEHTDGDVRFEIIYSFDPEDDELRIDEVAKHIGKMCVVVPFEEVKVNIRYYKDMVAEELSDD